MSNDAGEENGNGVVKEGEPGAHSARRENLGWGRTVDKGSGREAGQMISAEPVLILCERRRMCVDQQSRRSGLLSHPKCLAVPFVKSL